MASEQVEQSLICSVHNISELSDIRAEGVKTSDFEHFGNMFNYISEHAVKYTELPSRILLEEEFPNFKWINPEDNIKYYADLIRKAGMKREIQSAISRIIDTLDGNDKPEAVIDSAISKMVSLKRSKNVSRSFTDRDALRRYDLYMRKRELTKEGTPSGLSTGLRALDERLIGFAPGNVALIEGYQGTGKSWVALNMGVHAYNQGGRVVLASPEMTTEEMEYRWDAIQACRLNLQFPSESLTFGQEINSAEYREFLEKMSNREDWVTFDSADGESFDENSIMAIAEEIRPSLLIVDGLYLIRGQDGSIGDWRSMVSIANNLKAMATRLKCVVLITTQMNEEGDGATTAFSKYVEQPMDFVFWLRQTGDWSVDERQIVIKKMRSGRLHRAPITIDFMPDKGRIG